MAYHYKAIEMRYVGKKYEEICEALTLEFKKDFLEQRVRRWFMRGGILEALYDDFAKKENDRRRMQIMEEAKKLLPLIPQKYHDLLTKRFAINGITGEFIKDENGKKVEKLDSITVNALRNFCEMLGFKMQDASDGSDPLEDYFDRAEEELGKHGAKNNT